MLIVQIIDGPERLNNLRSTNMLSQVGLNGQGEAFYEI